MSKHVVPLLNRILIKKVNPAAKTKGGVVIPEGWRKKVSKGKVVAVGPGIINTQGKCVPCCLKVGDVVLLPDYGGTKVQYDEKQEYYLYRENDILAKINE
ncbi:10 kDa chaperonin-like [Tribolium madens]|uniref:10 kDa chaperonin-like n=1 Tax=Tribolium madens TaxID=41895 RepID=UPI001CF741B4|nr:10 kDa chaperonin-like [Tribolium madens]